MPYTSGKYSNNETYAYNYLRDAGFNMATTCGILANIERESHFNPSTYNAKEGAYGICQWRGGRRTNLENYCQNNNLSSSSFKGQLTFMVYEMRHGNEKSAGNKMTGIPDSSQGAWQAGYNFCEYYERADNKYNNPSGDSAVAYYAYYSGSGDNLTILPAPGVTDPIGKIVDSGNSEDTSGHTSPNLAIVDPYSGYIEANLQRASAEGFDYGYLYDMTYGGAFMFYVPEFEESADSNYGTIDIPGRSVEIRYYQGTSARKVTVSLELYAGAGLYDLPDAADVVGLMHQDINFVKSLEYPDYSQAPFVRPPAVVHLILGSAMSLQGVVSGVSVNHLKPVDDQNRSMYVKLSFTVTQVADIPPAYNDIRRGSSSAINTSNRGLISETTGTNGAPNVNYGTVNTGWGSQEETLRRAGVIK